MNSTPPLFPVLNTAKVKRQTEASRRLASWLAHPIQFPAVNLIESGQDLDNFATHIDDDLRRYLKKNLLIERLFPVQKCLIPHLSKQFRSRSYKRPNDICVSSPTGSGKTLAFVIPIVNYLKQALRRSLRALVILPTHDLALQVHKAFAQVCSVTHLNCSLATGGVPLYVKINKTENLKNCSILQQEKEEEVRDEYVSTIDILVTTPGTLVDLLHKDDGFSLKDLEILVIDEADKLIMSHKHDWLNAIEKSIFQEMLECPCKSVSKVIRKQRVSFSSITGCAIQHYQQSKPLQKLLFSATLSSDPQVLMQMNLFQPRLFLATKPTITGTKIRNSLSTPCSTPSSSPLPFNSPIVHVRNELLTSTAIPEQLEEKMFITEAKEKLFVLWYIFHELKYKNVICFTNQIKTCAKLCKFLNDIESVRAVEFSSSLKPEVRQKYLNEFKLGKIEVFVSTDLMARGMDVEGVEYVISYDMPGSEVYYVHRVGRTARAGNKGTAITLVDTKQLVQFKKIIQLAHKMPNSMRLSDVVEEMKVPQSLRKSSKNLKFLSGL